MSKEHSSIKMIVVCIDEKLYEKVETICKADDRSLSSFGRLAIKKFIGEIEKNG